MSINNVSDISNFVQKADDLSLKPEPRRNDAEVGSNIASKEASAIEVVNKDKLAILEGQTKVDIGEFVQQKLEAEKESQIDKTAVNNAIDIINQKVMLKSTNLIFEFDDLGDPPIVKVVDKDNGEVIREVPPKEMQEIAKAMSDIADSIGNSSGILFDSKI